MQKPGVQASIIAEFIQWPSSFKALKKPLGFNREMHCDATGMYEKEIQSADLLYVADSERTCLRDERVLTRF